MQWLTKDLSAEGPEEDLIRVLLREHMENVFCKVLSEREQTVIRKKYAFDCEEMKTVELARSFGLSSGRVRQIELAALGKMRNHYIEEGEMMDMLALSSQL